MAAPQPRTLTEFGPLTAAEQKVLDELDTGEDIDVGIDVPDADAGEDCLIRARFLRWVILGCNGNEAHRPHEKGVRIGGALITGEGEDRNAHAELNLHGAEVGCDVVLLACRFTARPNLLGARMQGLVLNRSHLPGLLADGLETRGSVAMDGVESEGEIGLPGAQIGGDLECCDAKLKNADSKALNADGARVTGDVFLRNAEVEGGSDCLVRRLAGA